MRLRPYQEAALDAIGDRLASAESTLIVLPTGCGKTVVFSSLIHRGGNECRSLVLAHREELIQQAARKIGEVAGSMPQIEMAEMRAEPEWLEYPLSPTRCVVSSVQTLSSRRMLRFTKGFDLIVIDEAHHAAAESYRRIVEHYRRVNPALRVLGVTATPDRTDRLALKSVFKTVAHEYSLPQAISDGWLAPLVFSPYHIDGLDYSTVRTTAGELNGRDLEGILVNETALHMIAQPTHEIVGNRRAIVFCVSVAHAHGIAEVLNRWTPGCAAAVDGKTPKDERRALLSRFASGDVRIVCNCGVLTEGFDDPGVEVIVLARPTKSRALYAQMVGRGTRALPGIVDGPETAEARRAAIAASAKPSCEVVDFVGNCGKHELVSLIDILGGEMPEAVRQRAEEMARDAGGPVDVSEIVGKAAEDLAREKEEREEAARREAARRASVVVKAVYRKGDTLGMLGLSRGENVAPPQYQAPLTEKQRMMLERAGVDPNDMSPDDARVLVGDIVRRIKSGKCTVKQARILARNGLDVNMTKAEASSAIDRIFGNRYGAARDSFAHGQRAQVRPEYSGEVF